MAPPPGREGDMVGNLPPPGPGILKQFNNVQGALTLMPCGMIGIERHAIDAASGHPASVFLLALKQVMAWRA